MHSTPRPVLRPLLRSASRVVTTVAALALVGAGIAPAAAAAEPDQTLTVEGTLVNLVVEQPEGQVSPDAELEVRSAVEVDGELHELPAGTPVDPGVTGDDVTVTIEADAGLAAAEALEIATESADATVDPAAEAQIVEVAAVGEATTGATAAVLAEGALGTHTLTVLPVYWGSTDGTSQASLANLASTTAQYWAEQSGGGISVQASARGWAPIADPGTCNTDVIFDRALAAHGVPEPTGTSHVLVYFPKRSDCGGWAGLASIGGGYIWVNGTPLADVFAHEFGHNFGLGHANTYTCNSGGARVALVIPLTGCTATPYGDYADVMGIAMIGRPTGSLNTALADQLGLAQLTDLAGQATGVATFDLAPLGAVHAGRGLRVPAAGGELYVDYRPAVGRDSRWPTWAGVQVHLMLLDARAIPTSYLLNLQPAAGDFANPSLPVGQTWTVPGTTVTFTVLSTGATARISVTSGTPPVGDQIERYVTRVYADLFERGVDPSGMATWSAALRSGTPRVAVANAITYSTEYRSRLITASYMTYLGRVPDVGGLQYWVAMMAAGGTIQQMEAGFLASPEYYQQSGSTDAGWVRKLYQHVLGRDAAAAEVDGWVRALSSGMGRGQVAMGFLLSTEHLTTVVEGYYQELLGRGIDPSGQWTWVTAIQNGARIEAIIGAIISSEEYFSKV